MVSGTHEKKVPIQKSAGVTASEQYLAALCERSFLSLWSYPNVHRDQGRHDGKGVGKELCDILVVFDQHIIVFSDKSCGFPDTGNLGVDWCRWFRRAVQKSANQVYGAERWLRDHPDRVFVDPACTQPFPITLPPPQTARVHRVVVALNAATRCKLFFNNSGTGSLMIQPDIVGDAHLASPFRIGQLDPARGYVHIFDDVTLNIILRELDTITDFTEYLTRKEAAVTSGRLGGAAGEEELLAHYLTELNGEGHHDIIIPADVTAAWFIEGSWQDVSSNTQYAAKKKADQQSYAWDRLIEAFSKHIAAGTLASGNEHPLTDHELGLRIMASEPRLARRNLAEAILDLMRNAPRDKQAVRHVLSKQSPERGYVFLVSPKQSHDSYDQYRQKRTALLAAYCHVAKLKSPALLDIVGIAVDLPGPDGGSEDLLYLNARNWTEEENARTRELQEVTGILVSPRETHYHDNEYPEGPPLFSEPPTERGNRRQRRAVRAEARRRRKRQHLLG